MAGVGSWSWALNQIKQAYATVEQFVSGAIIFNFEEKPDEIEELKQDLEKAINIPIRLIGGTDFARIILQHFPKEASELFENSD